MVRRKLSKKNPPADREGDSAPPFSTLSMFRAAVAVPNDAFDRDRLCEPR